MYMFGGINQLNRFVNDMFIFDTVYMEFEKINFRVGLKVEPIAQGACAAVMSKKSSTAGGYKKD